MALQNKMGIIDSAELARIEEKISKAKAVVLYENNMVALHEIGKFSGLAKIHEFLFEEIYDFAGNVFRSGFKKQLRNRQGTAQDFSVYMVYNKDVKGKDVASLFYAKLTN